MGAAPLSPRVVEQLTAIVGADKFSTDPADLQTFGRDWTRAFPPAPSAIVFPRSIEQVQALVRLANAEGLALVPSGGRTGLSGGAVATRGELIVAFDYLNKILDFDPIDRSVTCQAGVITEQLQQFAEQQGLYYPVDFASSGSSQIGGNIATNAGGIKVIRYGMTRDWVAGLKVVTGSGEILELNRGLLKNNAGYDLRQLFIGGEGTLGFIVEATMRLARPPVELTALVLGVDRFAQIMDVLNAFQAKMDLTAFEFFSEKALVKVVEHSGLQRPFETAANYYALLEFENINDDTEAQALALFEHCVEQGWVLDGVMSQSVEQLQNLWRLREDISETLSRWTPYKNDIATIISKVPPFIDEVDALVQREYPEFEIVWFGHIGDGNVHLNILKPDALSVPDFHHRCHRVSQWVFEIVQRYGGSVSAEHGVGLLKKDYLRYGRSAEEIALMKQIKRVFDPIGVMVEVPAAVYQARELAKRVSFLSVGSNDLTQYLLAVDRNNARVADLYHAYHPAVLQALQKVADDGHAEGRQVSICGELAGDPAAAILLLAMGYDMLSMNATNLPRVKSVIRSVSFDQAKSLLARAMKMESSVQIRTMLEDELTAAGMTKLLRPGAKGSPKFIA